jgi:alkylhydroperoxidase family enzyme
MHTKAARKGGESERRLYALAAWRDAAFFSDTLARNVDRLRRRCGSARDSRPAVELFHLGGRVAATVRPAFDRESHPAPSPHLHDGKLSYEHRKEARWLTMSGWRTAGSTRARTRR